MAPDSPNLFRAAGAYAPLTVGSRALAGSAATLIEQSRVLCSHSQITLVRSRAILAESALMVRRGCHATEVLRGVRGAR